MDVGRRSMRSLIAIAIAIVSLAFSTPASAKKMLVIVWDGANYFDVRDLYHRGELPNLSSVGPMGQLATVDACDVDGCMLTHTAAQFATMFTSADANTHGVWTNDRYVQVPKEMTFFWKLKEGIPTIKIGFISPKAKCEYMGANIYPDLNSVFDFYSGCNAPTSEDEFIADTARTLLTDYTTNGYPDWFMFVHFASPDEEGHHFGLASAEYQEAIRSLDALLGTILDVTPPDVKVVVASDHGFGYMSRLGVKGLTRGHKESPAAIIVENKIKYTPRLYMDRLGFRWLKYFGLAS
jgi:hypothetical protein